MSSSPMKCRIESSRASCRVLVCIAARNESGGLVELSTNVVFRNPHQFQTSPYTMPIPSKFVTTGARKLLRPTQAPKLLRSLLRLPLFPRGVCRKSLPPVFRSSVRQRYKLGTGTIETTERTELLRRLIGNKMSWLYKIELRNIYSRHLPQ